MSDGCDLTPFGGAIAEWRRKYNIPEPQRVWHFHTGEGSIIGIPDGIQPELGTVDESSRPPATIEPFTDPVDCIGALGGIGVPAIDPAYMAMRKLASLTEETIEFAIPDGFSEAARKDDSSKNRYDLLPAYALDQLVQVYTFGARKYADRNWEKGLAYGRIFAALMRHAWAWFRGQDIDEESGLHHMAHAAFGCLALVEYSSSGAGEDDRPYIAKAGDKDANKINREDS